MKPEPVRVFVSHHHSDRRLARSIKDQLDDYHVRCFIAHSDIKVSEEWEDRIRRELSRCDAGVALLSRKFPESEWCDQETGWLLSRGVPVVAVMLEKLPHGFLRRYQGIKSRGSDPRRIAYSVVEGLLKAKNSSSKTVGNLVTALQQSWKYDHSREIADLLEMAPRLLVRHVKGIEAAIVNNDQVYDADHFRLPGTLRSIIKKKWPTGRKRKS